MAEPMRFQLSRRRGWRMPPGTVKVDRSSCFGNPFPVSKGTSTSMGVTSEIWSVGTWEGPAMWIRSSKEEASQLSVNAFRAWMELPAQSSLRDRARTALRGKNLACWCRLCPEHQDCKPFSVTCGACAPCHADVLGPIANGPICEPVEAPHV
ncbi:MAG: DUF4326 domain-containing protein [Bradyrhizobium sp.]